tara:strand:+ start:95 stop:286 length:192 start_codon:yes stop_codon:yes gene_type:complete
MSEKYWGATYRKHQKLRPSKRRRLNIKGEYDCSILNEVKTDRDRFIESIIALIRSRINSPNTH